MLCIQCGSKLDEDSKFCSNCGVAINDNGSQRNEQRKNVSSISRLSKERVVEDNVYAFGSEYKGKLDGYLIIGNIFIVFEFLC